ncbi:MAG: M48 family metallopeptidase [Firmicutes bacterium]|nr:M48 family metallopeptidase [Bacillota bacterium]
MYNLIRSKRKTISVEITESGCVQVRAPKWSPMSEIDAFVLSHEKWIRERQAKMAIQSIQDAWTPKLTKSEIDDLKAAALVDLRARIDKWAPLVAPGSAWAKKEDPEPDAKLGATTVQLSIWDIISGRADGTEDANGSTEDVAGDKISAARTNKRRRNTDKNSPTLTIGKQKSLWGSCDSVGNLRFNCLLMLAPESVRDYVVVHELCHLKYMNHSRAFWHAVSLVLPKYRVQIKWLKENGHKLLARLQ